MTETSQSPRLSADDERLVAACQRGDQAAWNTLVERYGRLVYSIPRRYGLDSADAEDVFQAVFTSLYRSLDSLKDHSRLSSWLITTAHRESWRVGKKSDKYANLDERIADVSEPPADEAARWEHQNIVQQALTKLGGSCERLLRLLFLERESPSYEEIAAELGMRVGSIGPTRARCFAKLERILTRLGFSPESL